VALRPSPGRSGAPGSTRYPPGVVVGPVPSTASGYLSGTPRKPEDVAVIGFDNREEIAVHLHPALSTVALPYYEMGEGVRRAVRPADFSDQSFGPWLSSRPIYPRMHPPACRHARLLLRLAGPP